MRRAGMRICAGFSVAATSSCSRVCRPHHTPFTEPPASQDLLLVGGAVERVSLFGQRGVDAQLHGGLAQRFGRAQAGESVSFEAADEQVGQAEQFRVVAADDDTLRQIDRASGLPDVYRFGNDARLGMDTFLQEDACQEQ